MAPIRLRHPKGTATIDIDVENATVQDLQQRILEITEILPSQQDLKAGYPPKSLAIVPELSLSSLGLQRGDQLIVTQKGGSAAPSTQPPVPSSAPSVPAAKQPTKPVSSSNGPDYVQMEGGFLVHRIVPDDNSCLFNAIALVFEQDIGKAQTVRQTVVTCIRQDPESWSDAILGISRDEYMRNMLKPSTWGGAIELAILANHYSTEISSLDVETGRIDRFTPSSSDSGNRCILIYSGIHYDAATLAPIENAPPDFHQTLFPVVGADERSDPTLRAASELAGKLRVKRAYTNTSTFDLKCEVCKKGLKGEKEATQHAKDTGHTAFGEY